MHISPRRPCFCIWGAGNNNHGKTKQPMRHDTRRWLFRHCPGVCSEQRKRKGRRGSDVALLRRGGHTSSREARASLPHFFVRPPGSEDRGVEANVVL